MRYEVKIPGTGEIVGIHKTEEPAIKQAKRIEAIVIAHEISGTYQSWTQVWPSVGETYSI